MLLCTSSVCQHGLPPAEGLWLLCRLEGECQSLRLLQAEADASRAAEKRTAETLRADLTQREVRQSEDMLCARPRTSATLCALKCVTGACYLQECLRMHAAEAVKRKAAMGAFERELEAALARALLLQGQLDSEISSHRDTQASLQRTQEQVQPQRTLPGCPDLHPLSNAACDTDRRMGCKTGSERGGLACAEPALLRAAAGVQRQPAAGYAELSRATAGLSSPAAASSGGPQTLMQAHLTLVVRACPCEPHMLGTLTAACGPGRVRRRRRRARKRWQPCAARCMCALQS